MSRTHLLHRQLCRCASAVAMLVTAYAVTPTAQATDANATAAIERLVDDACTARLVFLGEEGSHAGGASTDARVQIVQALVERCGFRHVAFESQLYDFEDLKRQYAAGRATKAALYDAIGGLWSASSEIDPLVDVLHRRAQKGDVVVSGIDSQVGGSTQLFSQRELGATLTRRLPGDAQHQCRATIDRLTQWTFDAAHPFDDDYRSSLQHCVDDAAQALSGDRTASASERLMLTSFRAFAQTLNDPDQNTRDRQMADNLRALLAAMPKRTRTVVWTANVHAMGRPLDGRIPTAQFFRDGVRRFAVIAASGQYGRGAQGTRPIEPPAADALESVSMSASGPATTYLDARELRAFDGHPSRVLGYATPAQATWSQLFDGVLVLASERPPNDVRPRTPMQPIDSH